MIWLILLLVLCGVAFLPLGFRAIYREQHAGVWLLIGPVKLRVYPRKPNRKNSAQTSIQKKHKENRQKGGSFRDFLPVTRRILDFLGQFRRKIRVNNLELKLALAGDDPADLAINYGRAWGAMGSLASLLEQAFVIKKRDVDVLCDFMGDKTRIYARLDATITLGRTLHLLSCHGLKILKEFLELKKLRKGGAQL